MLLAGSLSGGELGKVSGGAVFKFSYLQNSQNSTKKERVVQDSTLDNLIYDAVNTVREKTNMIPLSYNSALQSAASGHVDYMITNKIYGHYEDEGNEGFIGVTPMDRGREKGYEPTYYAENLTVGYSDPTDSINALMQSIYHRFVFLDFQVDEIGIAYKDLIYNYDMGSSKDVSINIDKNPSYVVWPPNGYRDTQVLFANFEDPNPLVDEGCVTGGVTGNPISIQFNPHSGDISLESFKLFSGNDEVETQVILSKDNDPNELFSDKEFALYPSHPLEINTKYQAVFKGYIGGEYKEISWSFITKNYEYSRYRVESGNSYDVIKDKTYILHVIPENCSDNISQYSYTGYADVEYIDINLIKVIPHGDVSFKMGDVEFDLVLSDSDDAISATTPTKNGDDISSDVDSSTNVEVSAYEMDFGLRYVLSKENYSTSFDFLIDDIPITIDKVKGIVKIELDKNSLETDENGNLSISHRGKKLTKDSIPMGAEVKIDDETIQVNIKNMPDKLRF